MVEKNHKFSFNPSRKVTTINHQPRIVEPISSTGISKYLSDLLLSLEMQSHLTDILDESRRIVKPRKMSAEVMDYHSSIPARQCARRRRTFVRDKIPDLGNVLLRPQRDVVLVLAEQHRCIRARFGIDRAEPVRVLCVDPNGGEERVREVVERD
jgi:hypothetical protein